MLRFTFCAMLATALAVTAPAARAASPVSLEGDVKVEKSVTENGAEKIVLVAPDVVVPGDKLVFTTSYHNDGSNAVQNFVVTSPVPNAVLLSDDRSAPLDLSVDGGETWGKLAALTVARPDGTRRPAGPGDVTHVRWTIAAIAAGVGGVVQYRATVR
jgi:uncharacterized repeat protein (TIGR01451 family)